MAVKIQLRRGTAAQWTTANPTLADGEFGFEKDTKKFKIGDGVTAWNALDYTSADTLFKGVYVSSAALASAHPTGTAGEYANVDAGIGNDVELWVWDDDDDQWVQAGSGGPVPDASETVKGIVELATVAEATAGTDTARAVTPAGAKASVLSNAPIQVAASDEITPLTIGDNKVVFRMPAAKTLTAVRASLTTAQATGSILTVDVHKNGASILSTKITIDNTAKTSMTAATPAVISDASLAADDEIMIGIDQVGDGTACGLKITLI